MNTVTTYQTESHSSDETEQLALQIGNKLRGSEVIALSSDLGGGKTAFVRGLARGMGSSDHVASPTFTIGREYTAPGNSLTLYHFDFYRLNEPGIMSLELAEALEDPQGVVAIEWSAIVAGVLPEDTMQIAITRTGENDRIIMIAYPTSLGYLIPEKEQP